ncbi:hypothetical protein ACH5RR_010603 [Cinchona calisaya]|uniref:Uncharacterized protein n=1 Tax=Cinchona calisaya TaxID=153742 RepID=A0ABD3AJG5_9GENT
MKEEAEKNWKIQFQTYAICIQTVDRKIDPFAFCLNVSCKVLVNTIEPSLQCPREISCNMQKTRLYEGAKNLSWQPPVPRLGRWEKKLKLLLSDFLDLYLY